MGSLPEVRYRYHMVGGMTNIVCYSGRLSTALEDLLETGNKMENPSLDPSLLFFWLAARGLAGHS